MIAPLRDRLAAIIKAEAKKYPPGYDLDAGCAHVADALLASEEWQAREAVVRTAEAYVAVRWGQHTTGGQHATRERETWHALRAALARLMAMTGEETSNGG